jgi:hypothetical protein
MGHSITSLEDLFSDKHRAKRANFIHCRGMTMLTRMLNFALGFQRLGDMTKPFHGCPFL